MNLKVIFPIVLWTFSILLNGCTYNAVTGKNDFNFVSDEQEIKLGTDADKEIRRQYGVYKDPDIQSYVAQIGQSIAMVSGRKNIPYTFTVLDDPIINAFALPGGFIYVTRGIMAQMNSESELAFVLGHEITHVAARHGAQRMSQAQSLNWAYLGAGLLFGQESVDQWAGLVGQAANLAILGYGRDNEFEADLIGIDYASKAHYNPHYGAKFLETLKRQEKYESNFLQNMLSSHPPTKERITRAEKRIEEVIAENPHPTFNYIVNRTEYLKAIRGIVVGKSVGTGSFKDGVYQNDQFPIQLSLSKDWEPSASFNTDVLLSLSHRNLPITGTLAVTRLQQGITLSQYIKSVRTRALDFPTKSDSYGSQNGIAYFELVSQDPVDNKIIISRLYRIESAGQAFGHRLSFFMPNSYYPKYRSEVDSVFQSVAKIDADTIRKNAYRLLVHEVTPTQNLHSISKLYFPDKDPIEQSAKIAVFNGIATNNVLAPGELVKIPSE